MPGPSDYAHKMSVRYGVKFPKAKRVTKLHFLRKDAGDEPGPGAYSRPRMFDNKRVVNYEQRLSANYSAVSSSRYYERTVTSKAEDGFFSTRTSGS